MTWLSDWQDRWPADLRSAVLRADPPVQHVVRVTYTHPSITGERPLLFEAGTLTLDARAVGFATANVQTSVPTADELALLDPRTGTRIRIYAGYRLPGRAEVVHKVADMALRERAVTYAADPPTASMTLDAASDDVMLAQSVMLAGSLDTEDTSASAGLGEALAGIVNYALPGTPTIESSVPAGLTPDRLDDLLPPAPGEPLWSLLESIADLANTDVICDALGVWRFNYGRNWTGGYTWLLTTDSALANILHVEDVRSLEQGYANVAVITRTRDGDDTPIVDYGLAPAPLHWRAVGQSAVAETRRVKNYLHDWGDAARDVLARSASRGALINVETPTAWWVAPFARVLVHLPHDPESAATDYTTERVTFDLAAGTMTVRAVLTT